MNANVKRARAEGRLRKKKPTTTSSRSPSSIRRGTPKCSNQPHPQIERGPVLDERVSTMLLEAISSVNAAIASANTKLTYAEARQAMAVDEEEKRELTSAVQEIVNKHSAFFSENKAAIELCVAWAAVHAAHVDNFSALADSTNTVKEAACSPGEAFLVALLVLGPLAIFAVVSIVRHLRRV